MEFFQDLLDYIRSFWVKVDDELDDIIGDFAAKLDRLDSVIERKAQEIEDNTQRVEELQKENRQKHFDQIQAITVRQNISKIIGKESI